TAVTESPRHITHIGLSCDLGGVAERSHSGKLTGGLCLAAPRRRRPPPSRPQGRAGEPPDWGESANAVGIVPSRTRQLTRQAADGRNRDDGDETLAAPTDRHAGHDAGTAPRDHDGPWAGRRRTERSDLTRG